MLFLSLAIARISVAQGGSIDLISDTQQPLTLEKIRLRPNHNVRATSILLGDILREKPLAVYMLGDVVAIGSSTAKWRKMDRFVVICENEGIAVHGLLGNHDVLWCKKKGMARFQERFSDHVPTGYVSVVDSMAIVLLNSNFKKLTAGELDKQQLWYAATLHALDSDRAIKTIIVSCHHAPFSNSRIVGSSVPVQRLFVSGYLRTAKCRLFITGHAHAFEHFKSGGKDFLVIGGGGGLHQPLDTSATRIPDVAADYKPMFHYLSIQRANNKINITSHFLKPDFSGVEKGYSFAL